MASRRLVLVATLALVLGSTWGGCRESPEQAAPDAGPAPSTAAIGSMALARCTDTSLPAHISAYPWVPLHYGCAADITRSAEMDSCLAAAIGDCTAVRACLGTPRDTCAEQGGTCRYWSLHSSGTITGCYFETCQWPGPTNVGDPLPYCRTPDELTRCAIIYSGPSATPAGAGMVRERCERGCEALDGGARCRPTEPCGTRCAGDQATLCGGRTFDCASVGMRCAEQPGTLGPNSRVDCERAEECDPALTGPVCTGDRVTYCDFGVQVTVDCKSLGFSGCFSADGGLLTGCR